MYSLGEGADYLYVRGYRSAAEVRWRNARRRAHQPILVLRGGPKRRALILELWDTGYRMAEATHEAIHLAWHDAVTALPGYRGAVLTSGQHSAIASQLPVAVAITIADAWVAALAAPGALERDYSEWPWPLPGMRSVSSAASRLRNTPRENTNDND